MLNIGLETRKTMFGNIVPCYNPERTICDLLRNRTEREFLMYALKNHFSSKNKDLKRLYKYSQIFRVRKIVSLYAEVLLEN